MTDNLRDRIAAAIYDHPNPLSEQQCREVADAVIRELREEKVVKNMAFDPPVIYTYNTPHDAVEDFNGASPHVKQDLRLVTRYVTEWETTE